MRKSRRVLGLYSAGVLGLALFGCRHQAELKPPEQPQVLASPGET